MYRSIPSSPSSASSERLFPLFDTSSFVFHMALPVQIFSKSVDPLDEPSEVVISIVSCDPLLYTTS